MSRPGADGTRTERTPARSRRRSSRSGGVFIEHKGPFEISPGVWLLGPVPRVHPERNYTTSGRLQTPTGPVEDNVPEDTAVVVNAASGLIVISGCGHAGIANTLEYARKAVREAPIEAAIGGFHLFAATDAQLEWTAGRLQAVGIRHLLGAHCTGIEAVFRLRQLDRPGAPRRGRWCGRLVLYAGDRYRGALSREIAAA